MSNNILNSALDLIRRLPPQKVEENLEKLVDICPEYADDLLTHVDQPLKVQRCSESVRDYLTCDYNRDGDSYRSPWSNKYEPKLEDGTLPSASLRKLEIAANEAFDVYREMYFDGGVSSVYLWDTDDGFAGVVLLKKEHSSSEKAKAVYDGIHVFEVTERGRQAQYKLTSTVMLCIVKDQESGQTDEVELAGSMTRQVQQEASLDSTLPFPHIPNIGKQIEDMESKMRSQLQDIYFSKTRDILNELRSLNGLDEERKRSAIQNELLGNLRKGSMP